VDLGAFTSGLLTGLREGVEAALIVAIILAYLAKTGNGQHAGRIWLGAGAAIVLSLAVGVGLFATVGGLQEPYEQIFEGITMLIAAGVVTWMLFWMRRQAANVRGQLQAAVDRALTEGSLWALTFLAFTAVIREGIETALFLVGQVNSADEAAPSVLLGALVGLAIAIGIGYVFYQGSRRINLAAFFRWTGVGLIFIAAGLLSSAVHEFVEVGIITIGTQTAFDISGILSHEEGIGQFLRVLFGYSSTPEVITVVVWATYVVVALALFLRPVRRAPARAKVATSQPVQS
jgi:high-affinity iron transporter